MPQNKNTQPPKSQPQSNIAEGESQDGERIAKYLAHAGIASRREAERLIAEGLVTVNGTVLETPAFKVTGTEDIRVDGTRVGGPQKTRLWRYHKPDGLVTTHKDPQGRTTVFDTMPDGMPRVISIGRLDLTTEGLLLLTTDGTLARALELPSTGWIRRYRVRAWGQITQRRLDTLAEGVTVDGVEYGPVKATLDQQQGDNAWMTVAIKEGKNREIRNVMRHMNLQVNRLIRTAYGPFQLGKLPKGGLEEVKAKQLKEQLGPKLSEGLNF